MNNSKFWNSNNGSKFNISTFFKSLAKKGSATGATAPPVSSGTRTTFMKNNGKAKKIAAHLGVSGAIILALVGVVLLVGYIFIIRPGYALKMSAEVLKADSNNIL